MQLWLIILLSVIGAYLLILVVNVIFVLSFYSIMKKHDRAIQIILKTKYDSLKDLIKKMDENWDIEVDTETKHLLDEAGKLLNDKEFIKHCDDIKKKLSYINSQLSALCEEDERVVADNDYILIKENVSQLDNVYRSNVIMFNADVLGFNYWVRFLPFRYLWLLFRIKLKDFIS